MRKPSIHITENALASILNEVFEENNIKFKDSNKLAQLIVLKGRGHSLSNRSVVISNDKLKRDANKVTMTGRTNTAIFAQTLILCRRQLLRHRGLIMPKAGTREFLEYKEAAKLATEFCNEYGFSLKEGYKNYITIGLKKMTNFSLHKFKAIHSAIHQTYDAMLEIEMDKHSNDTDHAHSHYLKNIAERTGFSKGYKENPEKYNCFIHAVDEARNLGISPSTFIDAQFAGFDWASAIPDPHQLIGPKAIERAQKYCFENGISSGEKSKDKPIDWKALKKLK
jgi:hypothetical protein